MPKESARYDQHMNEPPETTEVTVTFSAAEMRMLEERARAAGQSLEEFIRERVIAASGHEAQVFRFLVEELARAGDEARQALSALDAQLASGADESREARRARIAKEVRESFTPSELDALKRLFTSALGPLP